MTDLRQAAQQEPVAYFDFQQLKFTWAKHMIYGSKWIEFARTVEAKLKERNGH